MDNYSAAGLIDDTSNLEDVAAYIVSGLQDQVVPPKNQEGIRLLYEHYGVERLSYIEKDIGHEVPQEQPVEALKWLYE